MSAYPVPNAPIRIGLRKLIRCMRRERVDPDLRRCALPISIRTFREAWPLRAPDGARL